MTGLTPATVLRRVPELTVVVSSTGDVLASAGGRAVSGGPHCLAILDLFSEPTTFADALELLGQRAEGAQDWIDLTAGVARLYEEGVLRVDGDADPELDVIVRGSFDNPGPHVAMLDDRVRTTAFLSALDEIVGREDVVVDIGTGTGILAAGAARAGARHVYAVEATPIARHARAVFAANGFGDRVTVVEGWSTRVTLPEPADVGVAEILGSEALEERALQVLLDARHRYLKPGGCLIPAALRVFGVPVMIPEAKLGEVTFTGSNTRRWSSWYGVDLQPLAEYSGRLRHRVTVPIAEARNWEPLSDPVLLAELQLDVLESAAIDVVANATASASGVANGALAFFEAQLSPHITLTTSPLSERRVSSWGLPVWLFSELVELARGKKFALEYTYRSGAGHLRLLA